MSKIYSLVANFLLERPGRKQTYTEWANMLASSGRKVEESIQKAAHNPKNHAVVTHIIGIERWSQSRLHLILGGKPNDGATESDEYDAYRPAKDTDWEQLPSLFATTRADTVALTKRLAKQNISVDATAVHNQFGPLTARAWLRYLDFHANTESKRLKRDE